MKKRGLIKREFQEKDISLQFILLFFALFVIILEIFLVSAEFPSLPSYMQGPVVPQKNIDIKSNSQVDLYTGSFTHIYPIKLPPGTNSLRPELSFRYNSQLVNTGVPNFLGEGWYLSDNFIQRKINYTAYNKADDDYLLSLNGELQELVYIPSENRFHTEKEDFNYIINMSSGNNTKGEYWIIRTKDGTTYRFGFNNDSERISNLYGYTSRWSLDFVNDTYGNSITYTYLENPYRNDSGATYPKTIEYNKDRKRKIEFILESNDGPDKNLLFYEGNFIKFSRRLGEIRVSTNDNLTRKYVINYTTIGHKSLLNKIIEYGSDNSSSLPFMNFSYNGEGYGFSNYTANWTFAPQVFLHRGYINGGVDDGIRLVDINGDGLIDLVKSYCDWGPTTCSSNPSLIVKDVWLNNGRGWANGTSWRLPNIPFAIYDGRDAGSRIIDVNGDNFPDVVQYYSEKEWIPEEIIISIQELWINNGTGFINYTANWTFPSTPENNSFHFEYVNGGIDTGVRFIELNGDGLIDLAKSYCSSSTSSCGSSSIQEIWLNNGRGWFKTNNWTLPKSMPFRAFDSRDPGTRIIDINGDGVDDIVQYYAEEQGIPIEIVAIKQLWLNNGTGFINYTANWTFPSNPESNAFQFNDVNDLGVRLLDMNDDGLVDLAKSYCDYSPSTCGSNPGLYISQDVWINNGSGWFNKSGWNLPRHIPLRLGSNRDPGSSLVDINGDGIVDILYMYNRTSSEGNTFNILELWINNGSKGHLLKKIDTEFGGKVSIDYMKSTSLDNTGNDSISDLGFNIWLVSNVTEDNGLNESHNVVITHLYNYSDGAYDYRDREFRGFNYSEERINNKIIKYYFHQDKVRKGLEYLTQVFDNQSNFYKKLDITWNSTFVNGFNIVELIEESESIYDGTLNNPKIKNKTYGYDNFGNLIFIHDKGDTTDSNDDRYEYFNYINNSNAWIVNRIKNYSLFNSSNTGKIRETLYTYDNLAYGQAPTKGSLTQKEEWLNGGTNPITKYGYNTSNGNLLNETDPNARVTRYFYGIRDTTNTFVDRVINAKGHINNYWYELGTGNLLSEFDSNRIAKNYTYDVFGRKLNEILYYDNSTYPTTSYEYAFDGMAPEKIKISKRERNLTSNTLDEYQFYDGFGRYVQTKLENDNSKLIVTDVYYDNEGRLRRQSNPYLASFNENYTSPNQSIYTTNYTYDSLDRLIKLTNPDGTFRNVTYDHWNVTLYDENAHRKDYQINAFNNVFKVTEYIGGITYVTLYLYDSADLLISIIDSKNNNITYTYDSLGRKIIMNDPDLGLWNYSYDAVGNLIKQIDGRNNTLTIQYDQLNRKTKEIGTFLNRSYFYDIRLNNTLSRVEIGSNVIINYTYDNRLRKIKEDKSIDNLLFVTQWNYDSLNRITAKTLPDKKIISYSYNTRGLISSIGDVVNTTYNEKNDPLERLYFNLITSNYTYKPDNFRLIQIKTDTKQNLNYGYDSIGNIKSINDTANSKIYSMTYDDLDRLISTIIIDNINLRNHTLSFIYDSIGNILQVLHNNTNYSYYYGNRPIHSPNRILQGPYNASSSNHSIGLTLINPSNIASVINVTKGLFFNITVNVSCKNTDCGQINISFDPSQDTGFMSPLTVVEDNSFGTFAWTSVNNAKVSDNAYAISSTSSLAPTYYLKATNFSFNIPSDATINGVEVQIEHLGDFVNEIEDEVVKLVKGGVVSGNNKASLTDWATTEETFTYGGASDLWGVTLTPADVNAQNFGVVLSADIIAGGGFNDVKVDHIKMKVYYTTSSGKGLISTVAGTTPFYTNQSNPRNITLNAGQSQIVTAFVNATGNLGANYTFFVYANKTSNMAISNITNKWNVTIISQSTAASPKIDLNLITPSNINSIVNVTKGLFFNITVNITCLDADCGQINISFDPISGYNFTSEANIKAYAGRDAPKCVNPPSASNGSTVSCYTEGGLAWIDITSNETLDSSNNIRYNRLESPNADIFRVVATIQENISDITMLNWTFEGNTGGFGTSEIWMWNWSLNNWASCGANITSGTDTVRNCVAHDASNFINNTSKNATFIVMGGELTTDGDVEVDFVKLEITTSSSGGSSGTKGLISTVGGATPFYTNESNPRTINLNAGQSQLVTAFINATGNLGTNYTFFVYVNKTSNMAISNITRSWNVTIVNSTSGSNQSQQQTNTSLLSPSTVQSNSSAGSFSWSSVDNAKTSNNLYALSQSTALGGTYYLKATNFSFNIPTSATILGVETKIEVLGDFIDEIRDFEVKLVKGGTISGADHKNITSWPTTDQIRTYGNSTDLWGLTLNSSDVNAVNFGAAFRAEVYAGGGFNDINVDHMQMKIYYSV